MSKITEVKTGEEATPELICPLMSGQLVPTKPEPGQIATPGVVILRPTKVPCARERCQWWDRFDEQCAIQAIAEGFRVVHGSLTSIKDVLEPPTESPLVRIGDVLDRLESFLRTQHLGKGF